MAAYIERQTSAAARWSKSMAAFSAVLLVTAALSHRFMLLGTPGLLAVLGVVAVLAVMALLFAAYGFSRVWRYGDRGGRSVALAVVIACLVLTPFLVTAYKGFIYPQLNDIATDPADPPRFARAAALRTADMNPIVPISSENARLQAERYPDVTGRRYEVPADRVLAAIHVLLERHGWQVLEGPAPIPGSDEVTIEAVARTLLLAFSCDVAIRLTDEGTSSYVDMRSTSRYGHADFGDNAARITGFLAELDTEIASQAGLAPAS